VWWLIAAVGLGIPLVVTAMPEFGMLAVGAVAGAATATTQPGQGTPAKVIPGRTIPGYTIPGRTIPGYTIPGRTIPSQVVPGYTIPGHVAADGTVVPPEVVPPTVVPGRVIPGEVVPPRVIPPTVVPPRVIPPQILPPTIGLPEVRVPEITTPGIQVRQGQGQTVYSIPADILFDFDKANIRPDADAALRQVSKLIAARHPGARLLILGHTDAKGSDAYNQRLSERRAQAVQDWLISVAGLDPRRLSPAGRGETDPVAPNTNPDGSDNPDGRQRNRRVEISVQP
jgi:outer membrane protein OmpA-like peptidoglycan-associated protein